MTLGDAVNREKVYTLHSNLVRLPLSADYASRMFVRVAVARAIHYTLIDLFVMKRESELCLELGLVGLNPNPKLTPY